MDSTLRQIQSDIQRRLPNLELRSIFDVGAHLGETVTRYREMYPEAEIWAFEPVPRTFSELARTTGDLPKVHLHNHALGATRSTAYITARATSGNNMIVPEPSARTKTIEVLSGDEFCAEQSIDRINYLKVDTEGHDLHVVRGFQRMLAACAIDLIEVEAGMHHGNAKHVPLERFKGYLEPMEYLPFRLYEQAMEFSGRPVLRRCNVVFISERAADANIIPRRRPQREAPAVESQPAR